jgi:GAF domain-containing protein
MRQSLTPAPGTPGYRIARGENIVCIADLAEEADAPPTLVQLGGRSYALVALRHDGRLLGGITIFRREVRPFTEKEIALLRNFAEQAVIAIENARLIGELHERTDQVAELNRGLEARVAEQVEELGRVGRLKRFLAPQLAQLIVSQGTRRSSKAIAAKSSSSFAICAGTPPSPRPPNPKRFSTSCASTTALWGRW